MYSNMLLYQTYNLHESNKKYTQKQKLQKVSLFIHIISKVQLHEKVKSEEEINYKHNTLFSFTIQAPFGDWVCYEHRTKKTWKVAD